MKGKPFRVTIQSDYAVDPNHVELICHPNDYAYLKGLLEVGQLVFDDVKRPTAEGVVIETKQLEGKV